MLGSMLEPNSSLGELRGTLIMQHDLLDVPLGCSDQHQLQPGVVGFLLKSIILLKQSQDEEMAAFRRL